MELSDLSRRRELGEQTPTQMPSATLDPSRILIVDTPQGPGIAVEDNDDREVGSSFPRRRVVCSPNSW